MRARSWSCAGSCVTTSPNKELKLTKPSIMELRRLTPVFGRLEVDVRRPGRVQRHERPLWTCPSCGLKFVSKNLWHSCGRATLADWKRKMGPRARLLYQRFEHLIARCGTFHVSPAKTRIAFLARVRFAGITRLSEEGMTCAIAMPYPLKSRRFAKATQVAPGWWSHQLRVAEPAELDAQVQAWLRQSYRLMGMQARLKAKADRRAKPSVP